MQFDPEHLRTLAAVLHRGAFDQAAHDLHVTPSAVSQRIKALEDQVGVALIRRGAPCTATPAGARLAKHAEDLGLLEAQLRRDLSLPRETAPARLRVAINADSLATWFPPVLARVPDMLFDLQIDDQDHSVDWLHRGAVSAAVTATGKPAPGCDCHRLGKLRYIATASPAFMARWLPNGATAAALGRAPCITFNAKDRLQARWMQIVTGKRIAPPSHMLPSTHAFIDAALAGVGWGMNPEPLVRQALTDGRLVAVHPDTPLDIPLDWQVSRALSHALAPVTRAVRAAGRDALLR